MRPHGPFARGGRDAFPTLGAVALTLVVVTSIVLRAWVKDAVHAARCAVRRVRSAL
jgi:hypothetical protein